MAHPVGNNSGTPIDHKRIEKLRKEEEKLKFDIAYDTRPSHMKHKVSLEVPKIAAKVPPIQS